MSLCMPLPVCLTLAHEQGTHGALPCDRESSTAKPAQRHASEGTRSGLRTGYATSVVPLCAIAGLFGFQGPRRIGAMASTFKTTRAGGEYSSSGLD